MSKLRWKRSQDQHAETHCGFWKIIPKYRLLYAIVLRQPRDYWGRVTAAGYELRRGKGYGEHVGTFDTQAAAKRRAEELNGQR